MKTFKDLETKSALDLMDWLRLEKETCLNNSNKFLDSLVDLDGKNKSQGNQLLRFSTTELLKAELFEQNLCQLRKDVENQSFNF